MSREEATADETDRLEGFPHPRETTVLVGQEDAETEMLDAYRSGRFPHAWVLSGPEGIGKATLAWRLTRFLLVYPDPSAPEVTAARDLAVPADHPVLRQVVVGGTDVGVLRREWNEKTGKPYSEIRVEDVRRISTMFQRSSRAGGYRICLIDSVEDLNRSSANALLKLIEEPPPRSLFLLVAHRPARILPTLRSRCRSLALRSLPDGDLRDILDALVPPEPGEAPARRAEALSRSDGSVRQALLWLDADRIGLDRLLEAAMARLPEVDWAALHRLADEVGTAPERFERIVSGILDRVHQRLATLSSVQPASPRRLLALARAWDRIRHTAREAESLNLEKRSVLLSIVTDLAQAW